MKHPIKRLIQLLTLAVGILFSTHSVHAQYPYYQQALLNERVGFGNTTGGAGGQVYWVTSLADDYTNGTLRYGLENDDTPRWIMFAVNGTITLPNSPISVRSNKTIDGRGASITITTHGFWIIGSRNIIVENLNFSQGSNPNLDGIEITNGAGDVWVDHCSFSGWADEALSVKFPSATGWTDVTISWCRFGYFQGKGILIGHEPGVPYGERMRVTLHHNWFDRVQQRSPRIRRALVHGFNNYLYNWTYHGMATSDYGQLRTENNIFHAGTDKDAVEYQVSGEANGYAWNSGNWKINGAIDPQYGSGNVFNPATYYTYSHILESAINNSGLRTRIQTHSGATRSSGGFVNMSTRAHVQSGEGALFSGMYISGSGSKKVVIRAIGPSLAPWFSNAMGNPVLRIYNSAGQQIAYNDNWGDSQYAELQASGLAPSHYLEAAVLLTLTPGSYTGVIDGWGTGIASVEVYDIDAATTTTSKLVNISSRASVDPNNPPIAGLILDSGMKKIILIGKGPSLANAGVQNPISDPNLALYDANGTQIAYNNNWQDSQASQIAATGFQPSDWRESAILIELGTNGSYTAILRDNYNYWGIGSIEIYKL
jgi:pectate lyase